MEQVSRALEAAGPVDARVVLCAGGWGYARAIALAHPDVDLVLYGGGARTEEPSDWNGVFGAAPGSKGRYVGRIRLAWGGADRPLPVLALETVQGSSHPDSDIGRLALEADVMREGGAGAWARKQFSYSEE